MLRSVSGLYRPLKLRSCLQQAGGAVFGRLEVGTQGGNDPMLKKMSRRQLRFQPNLEDPDSVLVTLVSIVEEEEHR